MPGKMNRLRGPATFKLIQHVNAIRRFSQDVVNNIDEVTRKNDVYERLANLMFQALVFPLR